MNPSAPDNPAERLCVALAPSPVRSPAPPPGAQEDATRQLLQTAADAGVRRVTSRPEGEVERLLGQAWPFPSPFRVDVRTVAISEGLDRVEARARRSLEHMGLPRGETLFVGRASDLAGAEGRAMWDRLERLKAQGLFRKLGICAGPEDSPALLARRYAPDAIRVPCSLLDQRALRTGTLEALAAMDLEVQVSAVFAHGLLFGAVDLAPQGADMLALSRVRRRLAEARLDPMQAGLSFGLDLPGRPLLVTSVASAAELRAMLAAAHGLRSHPGLDWAGFALDAEAAQALSAPRAASAA